MSEKLGIDISNVVNVQLLKEQRGANYDNINHVVMMTAEAGNVFSGDTIHRVYKNLAGVKSDFGITSKTYQMATAFFGTTPNPVGSGGSLIVGHWRREPVQIPAAEYDTLTGSEIDITAVLKELRRIENGEMTLGAVTLSEVDFGDAVTFADVINLLNEKAVVNKPKAGKGDEPSPDPDKALFALNGNRITVTGKGLQNAVQTGSGVFTGNILGLGDSAVLEKAKPAQMLPAQTPVEAVSDVIDASGGCGYCFTDELSNEDIPALAAYSQANRILGYQVVSHPDNLTTKGLAWKVAKSGQEYFRVLHSKKNQKTLAVSYMARVHVVDFSAENTAMTIHLKELAM